MDVGCKMDLSELQENDARCECGHDIVHKFEYLNKITWCCCGPMCNTLTPIYARWFNDIVQLCKKIDPVRWLGESILHGHPRALISLGDWKIYQNGYRNIKIGRSEFLARLCALARDRELIICAVNNLLPQPIAEEIAPNYYAGNYIIDTIEP